jgi:hypothetical protein
MNGAPRQVGSVREKQDLLIQPGSKVIKEYSRMTHRERALRALAHQEPDRVPLDLGGSAYSLNDAHYFKLKDYLGIKGEVEPYRHGHTGNYYDERVLEALDIDCRHVGLRSASNFQVKVSPDGTFKDEWGIPMIRTGVYMSVAGHPLAEAVNADLDGYPWPDPYVPARLPDCARKLSITGRTPTMRWLPARRPPSACSKWGAFCAGPTCS